MKKIHTRLKRRHRVSSHSDGYKILHPKIKLHRPKTFSTDVSARQWAEQQGIKEYSLKNVKYGKRYQVVLI